MSAKRQRSSGVWEYQFERKGLLPRTYKTFISETEGDAYSEQIEKMLDKGLVPAELVNSKLRTVTDLLDMYSLDEQLAPSASTLLPVLYKTIGPTPLHQVGLTLWLDTWIDSMQKTLAPSTLKKRVELLARAVDWGLRKNLLPLNKNPMRFLARGYAGKGSRHESWVGQRGRRLSQDGAEERAIRSVLAEKGSPAEMMLFDMALESAMRLREMYTLTRDQISFREATIFLDRTKNGSKRQVPMSSVLMQRLEEYLPTVKGENLFPWWDGTLDVVKLDALSTRLSQRFARRFKEAGCPDLHFHDLRHCAVCSFYERTTLTDLEIAKITGHSDLRMLARYANLRGSNLSKKLW